MNLSLDQFEIKLYEESPVVFTRKRHKLDLRYSRFNFCFSIYWSNIHSFCTDTSDYQRTTWEANMLLVAELEKMFGPYDRKGSWHPSLRPTWDRYFFVHAHEAMLFKLRFG